jgi:hypothetical protein
MSLVTIPFSFTPSTAAVSSQVNANFTACSNAINSIDHTNIQSPWLYASQIVPTTGGQATFGGAQTYTFPAALIVTTDVYANTVRSYANGNSNYAYCPPVYTNNGNPTSNTEHMARGTATINVSNGDANDHIDITFSNSAVFSGATDYTAVATINTGASSFPTGWNVIQIGITKTSATSLRITANSTGNAGSSGTVVVDWIVSGY